MLEGLENEGSVDTSAEPVENLVEGNEQEKPEQPKPDLIDLDSAAKFKFEGREWTPKDFRQAYMLHADYTRKTQEVAKERSYYDNLSADLDKVKSDPSLVAEFRRVYPEKFHAYLNYVVQEAKKEEAVQGQVDPKLQKYEERLNRIESEYREREVAAIEAELDSKFKVLSGKYSFADEETVLARASALLDKLREEASPNDRAKLTLKDDHWDRIWKSVHERNQKRADQYYAEKIGKQKKANMDGRDTGSGGATPGQAPRQPRRIKDATQFALDEIESN